ncbi:MAG: hypothetical protein ACRC5M_06695 [Anaeroplasmataceae bacterium]
MIRAESETLVVTAGLEEKEFFKQMKEVLDEEKYKVYELMYKNLSPSEKEIFRLVKPDSWISETGNVQFFVQVSVKNIDELQNISRQLNVFYSSDK